MSDFEYNKNDMEDISNEDINNKEKDGKDSGENGVEQNAETSTEQNTVFDGSISGEPAAVDSGGTEDESREDMESKPDNALQSAPYYRESYVKPKRRKNGMLFQLLAVSLVSSILGGTIVGAGFYFLTPAAQAGGTGYISSLLPGGSTDQTAQNDSGVFKKIVIENSDSAVTAIAEKVGPSVVGIRTTANTRTMFGLQQGGGEGSGVIYRSDGYIITNFHVIEAAVDASSKKVANGAKIEVVLPDQQDKAYEAQLVGYDSKTDLAVIKIQASNLPAAEIGDSGALKVGEAAVAIGNPGGLEYMGSVTIGVIGGLNRTLEAENGVQLKLIQTDAAINPGNSGGPLVNSTGQVIGINSVKIAAEGYEGLGFAIPSNTVKDIVNSLIDYKYVKGRPYLGISVNQRFNEQVAKQSNVPAGVLVQEVSPLSGASKAGIQAGDIITKFDGQALKSYNELDSLKNNHKPGDTVSLEIYRDGQTMTVQVKLDEDQNN